VILRGHPDDAPETCGPLAHGYPGSHRVP
jgi:hypothetical protein